MEYLIWFHGVRMNGDRVVAIQLRVVSCSDVQIRGRVVGERNRREYVVEPRRWQ
jgi:hypothetical protein